jgi:hypothetical protein
MTLTSVSPSRQRAACSALAAGLSGGSAVVFGILSTVDFPGEFRSDLVLVLLSLGATVGVPVGAVVGWIHAPAALHARRSERRSLIARLAAEGVRLGVAIVFVGTAIGGALILGDGLASVGAAIASAAVMSIMGLIIFGLPAWLLAAAVGAVWVALVSAVAGNGPSDDTHAMASVGR